MGPGGQAAAAELRAALKDKEKNFQVAAAMALAEIAGPEAKETIPFLVEALTNMDAPTRKGAAVALGKIGKDAKDAVRELQRALMDEDKDVREAATGALKQISQ